MKVKNCKHCEHCVRITWSHVHHCSNYHDIGMSHAYAYCKMHKKRVSEIKKCESTCRAESEEKR